MKKILASLLLLLCISIVRAGPILKIDYPTNLLSTALTFRIYYSDVPTAPLNTWVLLSTQVGTNTIVPISITSINRYYVAQVSNLWGVAFSDIVLSPAALVTNIPLRIVP